MLEKNLRVLEDSINILIFLRKERIIRKSGTAYYSFSFRNSRIMYPSLSEKISNSV